MLAALRDVDAALRDGRVLPLTPPLIMELNRILINGTEHETHAIPGQYRRHGVVVGSVYQSPEWGHVPDLMDRMCRWLHESL